MPNELKFGSNIQLKFDKFKLKYERVSRLHKIRIV